MTCAAQQFGSPPVSSQVRTDGAVLYGKYGTLDQVGFVPPGARVGQASSYVQRIRVKKLMSLSSRLEAAGSSPGSAHH